LGCGVQRVAVMDSNPFPYVELCGTDLICLGIEEMRMLRESGKVYPVPPVESLRAVSLSNRQVERQKALCVSPDPKNTVRIAREKLTLLTIHCV